MDRYDGFWHIYKNLNPTSSESVLDVGCSDGLQANYLAQQLGHGIIGLDIDGDGFEVAKRGADKVKHTRLVQCVRGDAEALPFGDRSFETVVIVYSLHHMAHPASAVCEAWRVLKLDGRLLIMEIVIGEDEPRYGCRTLLLPEVEEMLENARFGAVATKRLDLDTVLFVADKRVASKVMAPCVAIESRSG